MQTLDDKQIDYILSEISPCVGINSIVLDKSTKFIQDNLRSQLKQVKLLPKKIDDLKRIITAKYNQNIISPGEPVGILAAQSIGERQTQMTLNSFHSAGLAIQTVVTGVPRFSELLNATKNQKSTSCKLLVPGNMGSISDIRKYVNHNLIYFDINKLSKSCHIYEVDKRCESEWDKTFEMFYGIKPSGKRYIRIILEKKILYTYSIDLCMITSKIKEQYQDSFCIFSPNHIGIIDIFTEDVDILSELGNVYICGVKGVNNMFFSKNDNNWNIITDGGNLSELLKIGITDYKQIKTNNPWDIYETLGIEAARQFLVEEFTDVVSSDGTFINKCHITLLVDIMTFTGTITPISRYGMSRKQFGIVSRITFEESIDNFLQSSFYSESETITDVSASILFGDRPCVGSGLNDILCDTSYYTK